MVDYAGPLTWLPDAPPRYGRVSDERNRTQQGDGNRILHGNGAEQHIPNVGSDDRRCHLVDRPGTKFSGPHKKDDYLSNLSMLFADAAGDLEWEFTSMTAEEDRVAVLVKGHLPTKDGRTYRNTYNFLLHVRNEKIASGREFFDVVHVNETFGATATV